MFKAFLMMMVFGLGASLPLLLIAYGMRSVVLARRHQLLRVGDVGKKLLGFSLAVISVLVLTGIDRSLEKLALRVLPDAWISLTTRY